MYFQAVTKLGVSLQNVELNEANVSEVLRLFIIGTNEGEPHEVRKPCMYVCI